MRQKKIKIFKYLRNSLLYYKANIELDNQINNQFNEYQKSKEKVYVKTLYR